MGDDLLRSAGGYHFTYGTTESPIFFLSGGWTSMDAVSVGGVGRYAVTN